MNKYNLKIIIMNQNFSKICLIIFACFLVFSGQLVLAQEQLIIRPPQEPLEMNFAEIIFNIFNWIFLAFVPLILLFSLYIYFSLALMTIAKKTRTSPAWIAWIPIANLYLLSKIARMHCWPLFLFLYIFVSPLFFYFIPEALSWILIFLALLAYITLLVFIIIWCWRMFERAGRPGWWVLFLLVPVIGQLVFLVFLGIAAWGKNSQEKLA